MKSTHVLLAAMASCLLSAPATAQISGTPVIIKGPCESNSGVTIDDGKLSQFGCDGAIIMRTNRGTVLVQFADSTGDDGRLLGFGGVIEGKQGFGANTTQMMKVQRIYLGTDTPVSADKGTCILNWTGLERTGGKLISVICGGVGVIDNQTVMAIAGLGAKE